VLAKKGPLGKIWLAAHMGEKKVPKVQVVATNIPESIAHIENPSVRPRQSQRVAATVESPSATGAASLRPQAQQPGLLARAGGCAARRAPVLTRASFFPTQVPMALRMSGHLMLGVVRIFSRKVTYLLSDCSEAMVKIKDAFRGPGGVDMAPGAATRRYDDITNPENFDEMDLDAHFVPAQAHHLPPLRTRGRRSPSPLICPAPADRQLTVLPSPAADVVCDRRRRCDGGHLDPR
jgi:hypothetical protein